MTKEEKIQEAYGEDWEFLKQYVNLQTGIADIPSTTNRSEYLKKYKHLATWPDIIGFKQSLIPYQLYGMENNNGWTRVEDALPEEGFEVICFNERWIDEDFNPKGVRIGFLNGNEWTTAHYWNYQDTYVTISHSNCDNDEEFSDEIKDNIDPTHYMLIGNPPIY
ncbi:hypothetical protein [Chryseobacterium sp. ON_d1]|uniref:hypothetical protein n=1 Tax=Chryseobacterium sp. ON_d1 TaxID=2583211 RepID=UPI0011573683|nr:hypothetical protein [Chryseobacterium sp. ON_d1]GEJ46038.1 hypothetical protein CRS_26460 [Chryseobacterium sp. ON_d1]